MVNKKIMIIIDDEKIMRINNWLWLWCINWWIWWKYGWIYINGINTCSYGQIMHRYSPESKLLNPFIDVESVEFMLALWLLNRATLTTRRSLWEIEPRIKEGKDGAPTVVVAMNRLINI